MPSHSISIAAARARSARSVQTIFASLAGLSLALALAFHLLPPWDGLSSEDALVISRAFLLLAALDTGMMFVWERLYPEHG